MDDKATQTTQQPPVISPPGGAPNQPLIAVVKKRRVFGRRLLAIVLLVIVATAAGFGGAWLQGQMSPRPAPTGSDGNTVISQDEGDTSAAISKVSASVVSIVTEGQSTTSTRGTTQTEVGAGTGIIVSSNGIVMTNNHVVQGSNTIKIVRSDGTAYADVTLLGSDPLNDVAFLQIKNVNNLPAAQIGDSATTRVGQKVIAIGNSLGQYQNTVTSGIISGKGRPVSAQAGSTVENLTDLIQTDAAINPGNSGGPLINTSGQVIGINTAIAQDAQGIGFAIPINATKGLLKGVLATGKVERTYLGVNYITITPDVAQQQALPVKSGAYVWREDGQSPVVTGSPADKAGLKSKDIITKINGRQVGEGGSVGSLVAEFIPGDTVQLTILRGGKEMVLSATLGVYRADTPS